MKYFFMFNIFKIQKFLVFDVKGIKIINSDGFIGGYSIIVRLYKIFGND